MLVYSKVLGPIYEVAPKRRHPLFVSLFVCSWRRVRYLTSSGPLTPLALFFFLSLAHRSIRANLHAPALECDVGNFCCFSLLPSPPTSPPPYAFLACASAGCAIYVSMRVGGIYTPIVLFDCYSQRYPLKVPNWFVVTLAVLALPGEMGLGDENVYLHFAATQTFVNPAALFPMCFNIEVTFF